MGDPITAQFVGHNIPGLGSMTLYQPAEKPLRGSPIHSILYKHIDDVAILVDSTPAAYRS